ncbi:zinc finger and BTB domain containing 9 L homeolog isoform X1 [Xenopus laevis]|uniref:Zinc finger and BTB domain containing 9 L homeolog isoform X1 n=3 Tax=Xenopus laevis TaxID=8355 RepID=A0A8J0TH25_XENLA|nr:zinc finger and BTB domain containing 9 L homeolog isoform X1 [Xenopus laevis]
MVSTMPGSESVQLDFPHYSSILLDTLNKQRLEGKFCDLSVQVQSQVFRAHKTVLAASSPYFHDKLLLNDTSCLVLPNVIQPSAFENLLQLIYSGRLCLEMEALPSHLLVASGLQMWQVVDRCSELLKEREMHHPQAWSSCASESQSPSSSFQPPRDDPLPPSVSLPVSLGCSDDEEVIKVRVSEEEEEEEEEDDIQNGANILEESTSGNCSYALPSSSSPASPKVYYIKQERPEQDSGYLKTFGMTEMQADYSSELSFVLPPTSSSSDVSLCLPRKIHGVSDSESFTLSKPVDLHGNEIISHALQAQTVHAPLKLVAAPDGKKFGCLCGKRFAVKPKRDRHIMLTFSLRPFGCSVCNKKFKLKHHLTEHMKTHGGNLYSCEDCGRKFRVQSCFQKHKEVCKGQRWAGACWTYK